MGSGLTEEYYIPEYVCGRIIGKGGSSIKEICSASNCKVKLHDKIRNSSSSDDLNADLEMLGACESNVNASKKLITLTGTSEQIAHAKVTPLKRFFYSQPEKNIQSLFSSNYFLETQSKTYKIFDSPKNFYESF